MRRTPTVVLATVLVAVVVNVPWLHQAYVDHRIDSAGRDVSVPLVAHPQVEGRDFVRYRVPGDSGVYAARVDPSAYAAAVASERVRVRVVPGHPSQNRVAGEVRSVGFGAIALVADAFLVLAVVALALRRRRSRRTVLAVEGDLVTVAIGEHRVAARADAGALRRCREGGPAPGALVLAAATDVLPRDGVPGLEPVDPGDPAHYRVRGVVGDVGPGWVEIRVDGGGERDPLVLRVLTAGVHQRADLRQRAEVAGGLQLRWEW